jgi:hypothetical protein
MYLKKALSLIAFAIVVHGLYAQSFTISGVVVDDNTRGPIAYAQIYLNDIAHNFSVSTVSNLEGNFTLNIPGRYANDILHVSLVGFESKKLFLYDLRNKSDISIALRQTTTLLPAITVSSLTAKEIILQASANINRNYSDISFFNKCFYWKSTKEADTYRNLTQGELLIQETIGKNNVVRNFTSDSLKSVYTKGGLLFLDSIDNIFYFDFVRAGSGIMNLENINEWTFTYDHVRTVPEDYSFIHGSRLDNVMTLKALVNERDYSVEEIDYSYRWKKDLYHDLNDTLVYSLNSLKGKVLYRKNSTKYNMKYLFVEINYTVFKKSGYLTYKKMFNREIKHEIVVLSSVESRTRAEADSTFNRFGETVRPIINTKEYCEAARVLGYLNSWCK